MIAMIKGNQKGFSLLELIVIVVIIGLLATIILAFMSGIRQRSRDTKRERDTHELRTALGLYATDKGRFPATLDELEPKYIPITPVDPRNTGTNIYEYIPLSNGNSYTLTFCYEYSAPDCKTIGP